MTVTHTFYQCQRQDEAFNRFFDSTVALAQTLNIGQPNLPRYRKPPRRYSNGTPHRFLVPKDYFRSQYFEGYDLLVQELSECLEQKEVMQPVLSIESQLIKAAYGEDSTEELRIMTESVFHNDLSFDKL